LNNCGAFPRPPPNHPFSGCGHTGVTWKFFFSPLWGRSTCCCLFFFLRGFVSLWFLPPLTNHPFFSYTFSPRVSSPAAGQFFFFWFAVFFILPTFREIETRSHPSFWCFFVVLELPPPFPFLLPSSSGRSPPRPTFFCSPPGCA